MERKRSLADDRNVSIKKVDKVFCFLIWDRNDYITEAKKKNNDLIKTYIISSSAILS